MIDQLPDVLGQVESRTAAAAIGAVLLLFGRRVYGLLLAVAGFVLGWTVVHRVSPGMSSEVLLGASIFAGLASSFLAFWVEKLALRIGGFVLGGFSTMWLLDFLAVPLGGAQWLLALVGAGVGLLAMPSLFGSAIVMLSSLVGAAFLVQAAQIAPPASYAAWAGLTALGSVLQWRSRSKTSKTSRRQKRRERKLERRLGRLEST